jgi:hypothetical protein
MSGNVSPKNSKLKYNNFWPLFLGHVTGCFFKELVLDVINFDVLTLKTYFDRRYNLGGN